MTWRDRLWHLLALRCEASSFLASQELDEPLGAFDRLAMWGHLLACRSCRRFRSQVRRIGLAYRHREAERITSESDGEGLSPESHRRIAEALRLAGNDGQREGGH